MSAIGSPPTPRSPASGPQHDVARSTPRSLFFGAKRSLESKWKRGWLIRNVVSSPADKVFTESLSVASGANRAFNEGYVANNFVKSGAVCRLYATAATIQQSRKTMQFAGRIAFLPEGSWAICKGHRYLHR